MTKYTIETVSTFYEVRVIEAENEETAKNIAEDSDYNVSKWLGQQIVNISEYKESDLNRMKQLDSYVFNGCAYLNDDGVIDYKKNEL